MSKTGNVIGVDLDGFIQCSLENGEIERFDTDNNSFDLMKGLIHQKRWFHGITYWLIFFCDFTLKGKDDKTGC